MPQSVTSITAAFEWEIDVSFDRGINHHTPWLSLWIFAGNNHVATYLNHIISAPVATHHLANHVAAIALCNCTEIKFGTRVFLLYAIVNDEA